MYNGHEIKEFKHYIPGETQIGLAELFDYKQGPLTIKALYNHENKTLYIREFIYDGQTKETE